MGTLSNPKLTVVFPVFRDRQAAKQFLRELKDVLPPDAVVVCVEDGSPDQAVSAEDIRSTGLSGVLISLERNVGHQAAISIGLRFVCSVIQDESVLVIMDADGEDRPADIANLLAEGFVDADIIAAERKTRVESIQFKVFYYFYKMFFSIMSGKELRFGNFMAMSWGAANRLSAMPETGTHVAAAALASKLRIKRIRLDRGARYAGKSQMNFVSLVLHGFRSLMVFAESVLIRVGIGCLLIAVFSVFGAILAIFLKVLGFSTPGWFSMALGILVLIFLQTGTLAIVTLLMSGLSGNQLLRTSPPVENFIREIEYV